MASTSFPGTATWLRNQWSNPSDIFTILLILGGDVVQVAIAQLCAGPISHLTPVVFSFGWVNYAVSAMLSAVGENRLMPKPEIDCCVISATKGYRRANYSWVLSRILRDFEWWRDPRVEKEEREKLEMLRMENREKDYVRIGLRVTVWCERAYGKPKGDVIYWAGLVVALIQLSVAAIPWGLYREWLTFFVTAAGTILAFASGALPQWRKEKFGVRLGDKKKDVFLTRGNGDHDVLLIQGCEGGMDLEALASPYRDPGARQLNKTRLLSLLHTICWIALLIMVAGYQQHTWYLVGVGIIGIVHNVVVAGCPRKPSAFGIDLAYVRTFVDGKVMAVLWAVEENYSNAGASLIDEFFPGKLFRREERLWEYARRRNLAFKGEQKLYREAKKQNKSADEPKLWDMPPLLRPEGSMDDSDIPEAGRYDGGGLEVRKSDEGSRNHTVKV